MALVHGQDRRKNVYEALVAVDDQIRPTLKRKRYVVIKPNDVTTSNALGATNVDALRGILDYLDSRFRGSIVIAESSAGNTMDAYENFNYSRLAPEYRRQKISFVDLNVEGKYEKIPVLNENLHMVPVRLAARLLDPDAFIICSAMLKTHNTVVATLSIKNMALGAPLHNAPKGRPPLERQTTLSRRRAADARRHHADRPAAAAVLGCDGHRRLRGHGRQWAHDGTPVPSRIAISSTDYVAADRVGIEAMGINPDYLGYLRFCGLWAWARTTWRRSTCAGRQARGGHQEVQDARRHRAPVAMEGPMEEVPPKVG